MSLSSIEEITSTVQFDNDGFSFISAYGNMILNVPYAEGFRCFENDEDRRKAFIYKALSAVSDEIGNSLYLNIKRYIDFVSNVDVCKIRSLKSMLYIFGFKETLIDKFFNMPKDVIDLMDVLSILKKYLIKNGLLKQDFLNELLSSDDAPVYKDENKIDFRKYFGNNAFILSSSEGLIKSSKTNISKLLAVYALTDSIEISNFNLSNSTILSSQFSRDNVLSTCDVFINSYDDFIVDDKLSNMVTLYNGTTYEPIFVLSNDLYDEFSQMTSINDSLIFHISDIYNTISSFCYSSNLSNTILEYDNSFINLNKNFDLLFLLTSLLFNEDLTCIDDAKYENYIENLYYDLLYYHITRQYNAKFISNTAEKTIYIYPYIGDLYFDKDYSKYNTLQDYAESNDPVLSTKMQWHIPASFDEKTIVDNIDSGLDSLDNYLGYLLSVLQLEILKRKGTLDFSKIGIDKDKNTSKFLLTRYSYYRELDVAEYANFIDDYYSMLVDNPKIYSFDSNYYELSSISSNNVILIKDAKNINPDDDINIQKIHFIAKYLATLTMYICKLREKIKNLTLKNYMKGTNLLLIYVINEYLIEYARNNKQLFLEKNEAGTDYKFPELVSIYSALSSHLFGSVKNIGLYTINIKEYYDKTQYFNIETQSTASAENNDLVNNRYWENSNSNPLLNDGLAFNLAEIEKFYLETLNMKSTLGDSEQAFANFMSSIYDLGANDSFIFDLRNDSELSIFSSQLDRISSSNDLPIFASDIYERLINLSSSYINFNNWLSDGTYSYPNDTVLNLISNATETYIFLNLSNTYLSDVSSMYDKYISCVNLLSDSVDALSLDYDNFLDGEYSFYFTKSTNKYCYTDNDSENGTYMFNYYVDNSEYTTDTMNLYEHLYLLQLYSTVENILNHSVRYIANDTLSTFNTIYSDLTSNVVTPLTSSHGMIDINSSKLDEEMQYTYDYTTEKKKDRIEFLKEQLANLLSLANNLKSEYESLENTFTTTIGLYDDGHSDYSFKDNEPIYCVSLDEAPSTWSGGVCTRADNKPPASETFLFCKEYPEYTYDSVHESTGTTVKTFFYFGTSSSNITIPDATTTTTLAAKMLFGNSIWGDFKKSVSNAFKSIGKSIKDVFGDDEEDEDDIKIFAVEAKRYTTYNEDDTLKNRCASIKSYMDTPTMMSFLADGTVNYVYGFMKDGTYASINSIETGISQIESSFASLESLASSIFGITLDGTATDIYTKLTQLITKIISYDTTLFESDLQVQTYNSLLKKIINLSSDMVDMQSEYLSIFSDIEQSTYLGSFNYTGELTYEQINDLITYCKRTDNANYLVIAEKVKKFIDEDFLDILYSKDILEQNIIDDNVELSYTSGNDIEEYVDRIYLALLNDIELRTIKGNEIIDNYKYVINGYLDVIENEISSSIDEVEPFDDVVTSKLEELNFFNHSLYKQYRNLFLTYGGREFCYDPYYNILNLTHPSYQVHPFVWNIVEKLNNETLIETGFRSLIVNDIEENKAINNLTKFIGDYGQTIDTWKNVLNGLVDYSGYYTRYEKSENCYENTGVFNEVVDYDGAFFPKAVDELKQLSGISIQSVSDAMTKTKMLRYILNEIFDNKFSTHISYDDYGVILSDDIYETISSFIYKYINSSTVEELLSSYLYSEDIRAYNVTMQSIILAISDGLPNTFFDKYYKHLGLSDNEYSYIAELLKEYFNDIVEKTSVKYKKSLYDIYKYGLDSIGNSYILFKQYNANPASLTFNDKRNTKGLMWIRLNSHPIAFPAFNGKYPLYYINEYSYISPAIVKLAKLLNDGFIVDNSTDRCHIANDMNYFYDFTISLDMQSISYVVHNANLDGNDLGERYDLGWVIADSIHTKYDSDNKILLLLFTNKSSDYTEYEYDYIDFNPINGMIYKYRSTNDLRIENDITLKGVYHPALIGSIIYDSDTIEYIYAFKKFVKSYDSNENSRYSIEFSGDDAKSENIIHIFAIRIINGITYQLFDCPIKRLFDTHGSKIIGETACVSYDKNLEIATIAFLTLMPNFSVNVETTDENVDIDDNANDLTIEDPTAIESTSHDIFSSNVTLFKFNAYCELTFDSIETYNMNADMSYIPAYPGEKHSTNLYLDKYSSQLYYCVELLGKSKNFDKAIECVNTKPDPYFDYNSIKEDYMFGRVYEDYDDGIEDKTFKLVTVPALNKNLDTTMNESLRSVFNINDVESIHSFVAVLNIDNIHNDNTTNIRNYTDKDLDNLEVLIYNKMALGKNPYYIGKICNLSTWQLLNYVENEDNYTIEVLTTKDDIAIKTTAIGTPQTISTTSKLGSNRFLYINGIKALFDKSDRTLQLVFEYDNENGEYAFIPEDCITILLYNKSDLTIFEYYHLFDAYGMINCYDGNATIIRNVENHDGWTIVHEKKGKYANARLFKSFYKFDDVEQYLEDIRLSDYTSLSDMYIFAGSKSLGFKYDEELNFPLSSDLYYYPTLNISYPRTAANYVVANNIFSSHDATGISAFYDIFNDHNTFIILLDDPDRITNKIGKINIPIIVNTQEDLLAYEDYLSVDSNGIANCNKYGIDDSRLFEFLQFESIDGISSIYTNENMLDIDDSYWQNKSMEDSVNNILQYFNCTTINTESFSNDSISEYKLISFTSADVDISKFLLLRVNYKVDSETKKISLYFNYNNYLNSPYVKIKDGRPCLDIIDGTYLKLGPGENGFLDVIVLFRYWNGNDLLGYKNSKILSYRIFNISDDKPKFIINKTYEIQTNSLLKKENNKDLFITLNSTNIMLDDNEGTDHGFVTVYAMILSSLTLKPGYSLYIDYPLDVFEFYPELTHEYVVEDDSDNGLLHIKINNVTHNLFKFKFKTINTLDDLYEYRSNIFSIDICDTEIYDEDNEKVTPIISNCTFSINSNIKHEVLAADETDETTNTAIPYSIDSLKTTLVVK